MAGFDSALLTLPPEIKALFAGIDPETKKKICEIRFRAGRPIVLVGREGTLGFLRSDSVLTTFPENGVHLSLKQLETLQLSMSGYSLHSVQNKLCEGFLTLPGGHRAGVAGSIAWEGTSVAALRQTDSINLRIAHEIYGAADRLICCFRKNGLAGTLIIGAPASGKTTVLRDLCRQISDTLPERSKKISLIDERGEIAAVYKGCPQNNVGWNTDVFDGYPKAIGIDIAVRCMSPEVIICDEIGGRGDEQNILQGINAGVVMIATAHAADFSELLQKDALRKILHSGAFRQIVRLGANENTGKIMEIRRYDEIIRDFGSFSRSVRKRSGFFAATE